MKQGSFTLGVVLVLGAVAALAWAQEKPDPMKIFGCGGGAVGTSANEEKPGPIFGGSITVAVSPNNDAVWAYSRQTGMWRKQAVENAPLEPIQPTVSADMATFQVRETLYAYSGPTGRWASLSLSGKDKPEITHHIGMIVVQAGPNLSGFSTETGTWDSINLDRD